MSDYQRFVSYLYTYQNNTKNRNCGFARVEIRDHLCRLDIHLKLPAYPFTPTLKVYVFVPSQEKLYGIFLGNASYQMGNVTGTFTFRDNNINNSSYCFSDLGGILIQSDTNLCFASAWKDINICPEQFVAYQKSEPHEARHSKDLETSLPNSNSEASLDQSKPESCESNAETTSSVSHETEIVSEPASAQETSQEPELTVEPALDTSSKEEHTSQLPNMEQNISEQSTPIEIQPTHTTEELQTDTNSESQAADLLAASTDSIKTLPTPKPDNFWETLLKTYPQQHLFFDDEIHNCVQLSPRDVPKISASGYPIANNAFFRHNCQSFQHFLIGKKENEGKTQYILAVPGIFNPKEQYMASMFGFPYFKSSQNSQFRNNCWGYWYRIIPEHWNYCHH